MDSNSGGLFSGFRQTVGVTGLKDDQQSRTTLNFGTYKGQLLGTGDTSIARPMASGRHQFSSEVQAAYEIAGMAVPEDIAQQLDQLDSIAVSSQAIAQMDPVARIRAIGDGYSEFDTQRMLEAESELMRSVRTAAGQILTIDARMTRDQEAADLVGKQIQNANAALTVDQQERLDRYTQVLSNTTLEQLAAAVKEGTGIGDVPITTVQSEYARRLTEQAAISQLVTGGYLNQLAGALGLPTDTGVGAEGSGVDGASAVNMVSRALTPEALDVIIEDARTNYDPSKDGHVVMGSVVGPNGEAVRIPVATLMMARQQLLQQEADMGESLAKSFQSQATVQASLYDVEMASIFSVLQNTGRAYTPESIGQQYVEVMAIQQAFEASYAAGNPEGMQTAVTRLSEFKDDLITSVLPSEDDPGYQSAFDNLVNGRPVSPRAVASSLAATSGSGSVALGVTPGSIFAELAPVIDTQIRVIDEKGALSLDGSSSTGDSDTSYAMGIAMSTDGGPTTAAERNIARGEAMFSELNRRVLGKEFADQARGIVAEQGLRDTLTSLSGTLARAIQETPSDQRAELMSQLRIVDEMRTMLFGKFPESGTFASGGGSVSGLLTTAAIPAEYIEGEGGVRIPGRPLTDPSTGEALVSTSINPARFAQVIDLFDIQLQEAGVDLKTLTGHSTLNEVVVAGMRESVPTVAQQFIPTTLRDKELFILVSEDYRRNSTDITGYMSAMQVAQATTAEVIAYMEAQSATEVREQLSTRDSMELDNAEARSRRLRMLSGFTSSSFAASYEADQELERIRERSNADGIDAAITDELTRSQEAR